MPHDALNMADLTEASKEVASCPLLNKLAPETRVKIYEYVLTFETPVKHAKEMRPFLEKMTGTKAKTNLKSLPEATDQLRHINTSILSTSKLIYAEANGIFYQNNVIYLNAPAMKFKDLANPRATDLSLAKQVITKVSVDMELSLLNGIEANDALLFALLGSAAIFPDLRTSTTYIHTDDSPPCEQVVLAGIRDGNLTALQRRHLRGRGQSVCVLHPSTGHEHLCAVQGDGRTLGTRDGGCE